MCSLFIFILYVWINQTLWKTFELESNSKECLGMSITLSFLWPLTFSVDQLYVTNMSPSNSWTGEELILFLFTVWKPNIANQKSIANIICTETKRSPEQKRTQRQDALATSIAGVWLALFCSPKDATCGETALCPQCCCVYQLVVLGCKKPNWFIVEFVQIRWTLLCHLWVQVSMHFTTRKKNMITITS